MTHLSHKFYFHLFFVCVGALMFVDSRLRTISVVAGGEWPPVGSVVASLSTSGELATPTSLPLHQMLPRGIASARFGSAVTMRTMAVLESSDDDSDIDVVNLNFSDMGTPILNETPRSVPQRQRSQSDPGDAPNANGRRIKKMPAVNVKSKQLAGSSPRRPRTKSVAKVLGVDVDEGFFPRVR